MPKSLVSTTNMDGIMLHDMQDESEASQRSSMV